MVDNVKDRIDLAEGDTPIKIQSGIYLIYRKPSTGPGSWVGRYYDPESRKQKKQTIATADDHTSADGKVVMNYFQAHAAVLVWAKEAARRTELEITGVRTEKRYRVVDAVEDYILEMEKRGLKTLKCLSESMRVNIVPDLGYILVSRLTKERVEEWLKAQADSPRIFKRKTASGDMEIRYVKPTMTEEDKRKRKYTANHSLTLLKTCLGRAIAGGKAIQNTWGLVKPFPGVRGVRRRFLTLEQQEALIAACGPDLQKIVRAALFTGGRFQEIAKLVVSDFDSVNGFIRFGEYGKRAGHVRYVVLSDAAIEFFREMVAGKNSSDIIFLKDFARRHKHVERGNRWHDGDQVTPMIRACERAKIIPHAGFHILRATHGSMLVQRNVNMKIVSEQLGHAKIETTSTYYAHLDREQSIKAIRTAFNEKK